ncbi:MAG: hypothetical protein QXR30_00335 [Candidatus Woesearchaeota archaeon]
MDNLETIIETLRKNVDSSVRDGLKNDCVAKNIDYNKYHVEDILSQLRVKAKSNDKMYYDKVLLEYLHVNASINKLLATYYDLENYKLRNLLDEKNFDFKNKGAHPFGKLGFAFGLVAAIPAILYSISQGSGEAMLFVPMSAAAGAMIGETLARYRKTQYNTLNSYLQKNVSNLLNNLESKSIKAETEPLIDYFSRINIYLTSLENELNNVRKKLTQK